MTEKNPPRIPAGMRDILPEAMIKRQYVIGVIQEIFEKYGFEPLQTSALELSETLMGKYGPDAERLIYKAWYGSKPAGEFALRYDLSVPLSRAIAMYPDLPRPFKRYQIAPVWRADRPQKGRYREFYQCDADTVGTTSMLADAEIIAVIYEVLDRLGFEEFTISINNRKIVDGIGQYAGVPESLQAGLYRSIDKLDKIGLDGVRRELLTVGLPSEPRQPIQKVARLAMQGKLELDAMADRLSASSDDGGEGLDRVLVDAVIGRLTELVEEQIAANVDPGQLQAVTANIVNDLAPQLRGYFGTQADIIPDDVVDKLLELLQISGPDREVLDQLAAQMADSPRAIEGIDELRDLFGYLDVLGVPDSVYKVDFAMVRGLAYYTGPIFETTIRKPKAMPSITGGGRYDELIGVYANVSSPATGTSFGIERIIDVMEELDMFPSDIRSTTAEVLVTIFDEETVGDSLKVTAQLREAGINTSIYFEHGERLGAQIGYASTKGIPFVVILGPDEIAAGEATVRRLGETREDSEQRSIPIGEIAEAIGNW